MFGQKVLNATAMIMNDPTRLPFYNVPDDFLSSGIKQTPKFSSYWIQDASFLRLQSITLGYNMSVKKIGIERLRFYVTGENLFVITKYKGIDPEVSIDGIETPGIDGIINPAGQTKSNFFYPKPRTFSFGVNVSF
jgi:iron complex outermembrane receptor protein